MKYLVGPWIFAVTLFCALPAFAQDSVASKETTVPGGTLMLVAYILFTAMVLGYLALLSFRQRGLDRDLEGLEKRLDELAELDA